MSRWLRPSARTSPPAARWMRRTVTMQPVTGATGLVVEPGRRKGGSASGAWFRIREERCGSCSCRSGPGCREKP